MRRSYHLDFRGEVWFNLSQWGLLISYTPSDKVCPWFLTVFILCVGVMFKGPENYASDVVPHGRYCEQNKAT